jgi:cytochrome bd-type quinol oxidase subunit 2
MDFSDILKPFLYRLPLFIIWLVGFALAIIRWKRNGRASLFALIGIFVLSFSTFFSTLFPPLLSQLMKDFSDNRTLVDFILSSMRVFPFLDAIAWAFILLAIFSGRTGETKQEPVA